jgi:hypothetical protein
LVDERATDNTLTAAIHSEDVPESIGARLLGQRNTLRLTIAQIAVNKGVIFEPPARDNIVYGSRIVGGYENNALVPTNRIITNTPSGFSIGTPEVALSGETVVNRFPNDVEILITKPGDVQSWSMIDSAGEVQEFTAGLTVGQQIRLAPGDSIVVDYSQRPAWRWRAAQ